MDAVTHVPAPANEPVLDYAPGSPERAALEVALAELGGTQTELPHTINGERVIGTGRRIAVRQPHAHRKVLGHDAQRHRQGGPCCRRGGQGGRPDVARAVLRRPRRHPAQGCRAALGTVARPPQRGDDARSEQDGLPGRDRRGLRAHRLLADQRPLRPADPRAAAPAQRQGHLEPLGLPLARGLRLRDHAVQLHRHRRQPADRPGAHGQHRRVEAEPDAAARGPADDGAARGGRHAARRHQHGDRRRHQRQQGRPGRRGPRRHPLHRLDADVQAPVARGRARTSSATAPTRASSARPAARTSSSPTRAPTRPSCAPR